MRESWFLAVLDNEHQVMQRCSPSFSTRDEAIRAWLTRRDRAARLMREITFRTVEG